VLSKFALPPAARRISSDPQPIRSRLHDSVILANFAFFSSVTQTWFNPTATFEFRMAPELTDLTIQDIYAALVDDASRNERIAGDIVHVIEPGHGKWMAFAKQVRLPRMRLEIGLTPASHARQRLYDNEVIIRWTTEITRTTVTQREGSPTGGIRHA
jgi:hypothetical protein